MTVPPPYADWFGMDAFDATYGYDDGALFAVDAPDEPHGFAAFWSGLYRRARAVETAPRLRHTGARDRLDLFDLEYDSLGGVRVGGWLVLPADGVVDRAVVVAHGYGGRDAVDTAPLPARTAAILPVARGLPTRSVRPDLPSTGAEHVLHGIAAVETYVHGGCAADLWCAATVLLDTLDRRGLRDSHGMHVRRVGYVGSSFGGGIGALALPWDDRFDAGVLRVPSFGQHDLRLTMPCRGSGEAVRQHVARRPDAREVLRFFDAATAARLLRIPMLLAPARWDPSVPPPGQFAVANAVPEPKRILVLSAGHTDYPGEQDEHADYLCAVREFLADPRR